MFKNKLNISIALTILITTIIFTIYFKTEIYKYINNIPSINKKESKIVNYCNIEIPQINSFAKVEGIKHPLGKQAQKGTHEYKWITKETENGIFTAWQGNPEFDPSWGERQIAFLSIDCGTKTNLISLDQLKKYIEENSSGVSLDFKKFEKWGKEGLEVTYKYLTNISIKEPLPHFLNDYFETAESLPNENIITLIANNRIYFIKKKEFKEYWPEEALLETNSDVNKDLDFMFNNLKFK